MITFMMDNTLSDLMYYKQNMRERYPFWSGIRRSILPHIEFVSEAVPDVEVLIMENHFNPYNRQYIPNYFSMFWGVSEKFGVVAWDKVDKDLKMWIADGLIYDYEKKHGEEMPRVYHALHRIGAMNFGEELDEDNGLDYTPEEYRQVILNNPNPFPLPEKWEKFKALLDETYPE